MTMLEIYRTRKDQLAERIDRSKSLFEAGSVIGECFETMQYQYLSEGDNDKLAEYLGQIISLVKTTFPLVETASKTKLWEKTDGTPEKKKSPVPGLVVLLLGLVAIFASTVYGLFAKDIPISEGQNLLIALAVGSALILGAGFLLFHRRKNRQKPTIQVSVDRQNRVKRLEETVKVIDGMLEAEKRKIKNQQALMDSAINPDEVQLFSYLLEAKMSGQRDFAMEQLDEVEHYLAKQDVLIINYTRGNERYFEFLPGDSEKTIRPALVRKGEVLAKGLARLPQEEISAAESGAKK